MGIFPHPEEIPRIPYLGEGGGKGDLAQAEFGNALEGDGEDDSQRSQVEAGGLENVGIDGIGAFQDFSRGQEQGKSHDLERGS